MLCEVDLGRVIGKKVDARKTKRDAILMNENISWHTCGSYWMTTPAIRF